jgi:hypothetical protein
MSRFSKVNLYQQSMLGDQDVEMTVLNSRSEAAENPNSTTPDGFEGRDDQSESQPVNLQKKHVDYSSSSEPEQETIEHEGEESGRENGSDKLVDRRSKSETVSLTTFTRYLLNIVYILSQEVLGVVQALSQKVDSLMLTISQLPAHIVAGGVKAPGSESQRRAKRNGRKKLYDLPSRRSAESNRIAVGLHPLDPPWSINVLDTGVGTCSQSPG